MAIKIHRDLIQGSEEWHQARCGLITASEMGLLLTPTLKATNNEKLRMHLWELAAQRISNYVEPGYVGENMLRGWDDEILARDLYSKNIAPVEEVGFVTNDRWGFTLGYSPDGLVGSDGLIECKSRRQKFQVQAIVEWFRDGTPPIDFVLQCQTGMLVTERKWIDLVSYSGGLPMIPMRINADDKVHDAIIETVTLAERKISEAVTDFREAVEAMRLIPTERRIEQEMYV